MGLVLRLLRVYGCLWSVERFKKTYLTPLTLRLLTQEIIILRRVYSQVWRGRYVRSVDVSPAAIFLIGFHDLSRKIS